MGNPSFNFGDGGPCWECANCRGFRTQPNGMLWTLCGQGMVTFKYERNDPAAGCRYWLAVAGEETGEESEQSGAAKSNAQRQE